MNQQITNNIPVSEDRASRLANRVALEAMGLDLFPAKAYKPSHRIKNLPDLFLEHQAYDEAARPVLRIAGRLTGQRTLGGVWFADLWEEHAKVQLRVLKDTIPANQWEWIKYLDIADFLGADGVLVRTSRGELTLDVRNLTIMGKPATTPAIGKVSDDGTRRGAQADRGALLRHQRHVALMTDPTLVSNLRGHATILATFRRIMAEGEFLELQTSIVGPYYGGAAATPFTTRLKGRTEDYFLRVSPEPDLKRAVAGGINRVYEIARNFRNEGIDSTHQPSFTSFECYAAYNDYQDMMVLAERLVVESVRAVCGDTRIRVQNRIIDFEPPWPRFRMLDLVARELGTSAAEVSIGLLVDEWAKRNPASPDHERPTTWGELLVAFFEDYVEKGLTGPCFVIDHPVETSPLTKRHRDDPRLTERFEAYVGGMEIANAYSELNDPIEQRKRLEEQDLIRDEPYGVDQYFLSAIDDGLPQTGGLGIGLDRLAMIITGAERISDVVPFPLA